MSEFTEKLAQMIAQSRTPHAPPQQRPQVVPGHGPMGMRHEGRQMNMNVGVDVPEVMNFLGMLTPQQKKEAALAFVDSYLKLSPEDRAKLEKDPANKKHVMVAKKLGVPIVDNVDGSWSIPREAYDSWARSQGMSEPGLKSMSYMEGQTPEGAQKALFDYEARMKGVPQHGADLLFQKEMEVLNAQQKMDERQYNKSMAVIEAERAESAQRHALIMKEANIKLLQTQKEYNDAVNLAGKGGGLTTQDVSSLNNIRSLFNRNIGALYDPNNMDMVNASVRNRRIGELVMNAIAETNGIKSDMVPHVSQSYINNFLSPATAELLDIKNRAENNKAERSNPENSRIVMERIRALQQMLNLSNAPPTDPGYSTLADWLVFAGFDEMDVESGLLVAGMPPTEAQEMVTQMMSTPKPETESKAEPKRSLKEKIESVADKFPPAPGALQGPKEPPKPKSFRLGDVARDPKKAYEYDLKMKEWKKKHTQWKKDYDEWLKTVGRK